MSVTLAALGFLTCFYILAKVSEYFIQGLSSIARRYHIPQSVAGATLAAIGSSSPELFTNIAAVNLNVPNVGVGTITGSAIFNILVIVGLSALAGRCRVMPRVVTRDGLTYLFALITLIVVIWDRKIMRWEAMALVVLYFFYFGILVRDIKKHPEQLPPDQREKVMSQGWACFSIVGGFLIFGVVCHYLIYFTLILGKAMHVDPVVMGLLANAAGTSIPDTMASVAAARLGLGSLAISNAVGSNIFDIWFCIGAPLSPRHVTPVAGEVFASVPFLLASFAVALFFIRSGWEVTRREGIVLLVLYGLYFGYTLYQGLN